VHDMVERLLGEQEAAKRLVLTADSVPQDEIGLRQLIVSSCCLFLADYYVCFHCFDIVGWASGRPVKLSGEVLVWLSVWSEVQIVLHVVQLMPLHARTPSSLASFKSRLVLPSWNWLTQVVLVLYECSSSSSSSSSSTSFATFLRVLGSVENYMKCRSTGM